MHTENQKKEDFKQHVKLRPLDIKAITKPTAFLIIKWTKKGNKKYRNLTTTQSSAVQFQPYMPWASFQSQI